MGFLDDLGKKVSDAGQKTLQKTKEISDIARINSLIAEEEKKINSTYYQIGKLYVSTHSNDCVEEVSGMVSAVIESEQKITDYRRQIQGIKGVQHCEKCGADVERGVAFCSSCGAPMPKVLAADNIDDYVKCDNCGTAVKKEMRFCTSCGKPMPQASSDTSETSVLQRDKEKKTCPKCGAELADDSVFCSECGTKI